MKSDSHTQRSERTKSAVIGAKNHTSRIVNAENIHEAYVCGRCAYEFGWIELFFSEKKSLVSGAEN